MQSKNILKIFFIIAFVFALCTFTCAQETETLTQNSQSTEQNADILDSTIDEAIQNSTKEVVTPKVEDIKVMTPNANEEIKKDVLGDTKSELKFTFKKFLFAMAGVLISSVIIFIVLSLLNKVNSFKIGLNSDKKSDNPFSGNNFIQSDDENEALRIFFEKTK